MKIIINWCLLVFGGMSLIGWAGSWVAHKRYKFNLHEIFSGLLYIAFPIFLLALIMRFILFCITGG